MIFAAEINATLGNDRRAINFKSGFVIPNQRSIVRVETVKMMIESARQNLFINDDRRRLHAVLAAKFPNDCAIRFVQAIDISIRRRKIDAIVFDGWLTGPGRSAPWIFVQTSGDPIGLKFPDDF